jgi:hypothetical protein
MKSFFKRVTDFFKKYYKHPIYAAAYGFYFFRDSFVAGAQFFSDKEFTEEIKKGRSFLRMNEGEIHIMNGGSIGVGVGYQKYEKGIEKSFREMIKNYSNESPYIIGLAKVYINETNSKLKQIFTLANQQHFYVWMPIKVVFKIMFPKNVIYGDSHAFYYDNYFQNNVEEYLLDKYLVVVSKKENIDSFKNNKNIPFKDVVFVETPSVDSYSVYERICFDIIKALEAIPKDRKSVLLVSTGPTSKQIIYEFSKKGQQGLDIGRGLDFLYSGESIEGRI